MRFFIPINEVTTGSQTVDIVSTGTRNRKTNRRALVQYFKSQGVKKNAIKKVMKAMGFVGAQLGEHGGGVCVDGE